MRWGAVVLAALSLAGVGSVGLIPASVASVGVHQIVPDPCADGVLDITGTIQACTVITGSVGAAYTLFTVPLQATVDTTIDGIGTQIYYSTTVGGQVFWHGLNPQYEWRVSIQSWNLPPNVRIEGGFARYGVKPGQAVTFTFVCDVPPCTDEAATATPTFTARPPRTRVPTSTSTPLPTETTVPTPTGVVSPTATATYTPTGPETALPSETPSPSPSWTPTSTETTVPSSTPSMTSTATLTASATETPDLLTATVVPSATEMQALTATPTPTTKAVVRDYLIFMPSASKTRRQT